MGGFEQLESVQNSTRLDVTTLLCPIVAKVRNRSGKNDVVGWAGGVE